MRYPEEDIAADLHRQLTRRLASAHTTLTIQGAGVHWDCTAIRGNSFCSIACFTSFGPEYYTDFTRDSVKIATSRLPSRDQTIDAVADWLDGMCEQRVALVWLFLDGRPVGPDGRCLGSSEPGPSTLAGGMAGPLGRMVARWGRTTMNPTQIRHGKAVVWRRPETDAQRPIPCPWRGALSQRVARDSPAIRAIRNQGWPAIRSAIRSFHGAVSQRGPAIRTCRTARPPWGFGCDANQGTCWRRSYAPGGVARGLGVSTSQLTLGRSPGGSCAAAYCPGGRGFADGHAAGGHGGPGSRDAGLSPRAVVCGVWARSGGAEVRARPESTCGNRLEYRMPTPRGVTEISRGSSEANTPGCRPPHRSAPRRWCMNALLEHLTWVSTGCRSRDIDGRVRSNQHSVAHLWDESATESIALRNRRLSTSLSLTDHIAAC
jgi:hypothetical protein